MKMNTNKKYFVVILIVVIIQTLRVEGAPSRLFNRDLEFSNRETQSPQTDPELNLANNLDNLKQKRQQQSPQNQQATVVRNQLFAGNNVPDVAPLSQYPLRYKLKLQQSASPLFNQATQQFPLQQLHLEDERAMRHQLPELIAQAHMDKNLERTLLKMVMDAMRASLTNAATSPSSSSSGWHNDGEAGNGLENSGSPISPRMSARLEQIFDEYAGVDPLAASNDLGQSTYPQDQQYPTSIGKREYVKPCFFNAVACAKNPFRDTS